MAYSFREPCLDDKRELCSFLLVRDSVIDFQPLERCCFRGIEAEFFDLFAEELPLFRVIVEAARLDLVSPAFDFFGRFLFACLVEPFDHFLVARAPFGLRFEIVAFHTLETEERVIQRTIEVIFANVSRHQGTALIDRAAKDGVTANANARTARGLFRQIFPSDFPFHPKCFG